jgi:DNA-binding NarL/FixJ family response regulator
MVDTARDEAEPTPVITPPRTRIRVLLADDHIIVRQGLARLLEAEPDIEVIAMVASDGEMAVELARQAKPDVVIMDVNMRGKDGIEATRRITRESPNVHVIGLSMQQDQAVQGDMLRAGATTFFTKDCHGADLIAAIRKCMEPKPATEPG